MVNNYWEEPLNIVVVMMDNSSGGFDWLRLIEVASAIIVPFIIYIIGRKLSHASIEIQIREMISTSKIRSLGKGNTTSSSENDPYIEDLLNSYDEACAKYLDKKVSRKSFERMYKFEIRGMIQNEPFSYYYLKRPEEYASTLAVYKDWVKKGKYNCNRH